MKVVPLFRQHHHAHEQLSIKRRIRLGLNSPLPPPPTAYQTHRPLTVPPLPPDSVLPYVPLKDA